MIGSLRGTVIDRDPSGEVVVEVSGIGYRVTVAPTTLVDLGPVGSAVFLHVHHVQREDAQLLYGFSTGDERRTFEALLSAQGVGPAMALAVLSAYTPFELRMAVASGDVDGLKRVKGIGAKTAARMVIDLKSKLHVPEGDLAAVVADAAGHAAAPSAVAEVRSALIGLGYSAEEVRATLTELPVHTDTGTLLKLALQSLAVSR